jgi:hypothetical protein
VKLRNIASGLVLFAACATGLEVWVCSESFMAGAVTFIIGALVAGTIKESD